jgi:AraC family transcriptional regulator
LLRPDTLHIGIPLDGPEVTPEEKLHYDCCITVDGGPYAVATHCGPFRQVGDTSRLLYGQ